MPGESASDVVARQAGYADEFSFNRAFKRTFGLPPGPYRSRPGPRRDQIAAAGLVGSSVGSPDSGKSSG